MQEENQEFNAFVNCQLSIVSGKAINKRDEQFWEHLIFAKIFFYLKSQTSKISNL